MFHKDTSTPIPNVIIFLGHFNDIDHISPIAFKMIQTKKATPIIIITNPFFDIESDYRLMWLRNQWGIRISKFFDFNPRFRFVSFIFRKFCFYTSGFSSGRTVTFLVRALGKLFYRTNWARSVIKTYNPSALVFEWVHPSGLFGAMVSAGKEFNIPSLSLPHGMFIYTNDFVTKDERHSETFADRRYRNCFDRVVFQSILHSRLAQLEKTDRKRIAVMGSARYCPEWQEINMRLQPDTFIPAKGSGCTYRIIFMLHQWNYNTYFETTLNTIHKLAREPWIHLVLKPHTREIVEKPDYLSSLNKYPNVEIVGSIGSVELIRWADAVIVAGSSIALEAIWQGKPVLYPKHHHDNTTIFESTQASWIVKDDTQLLEAVKHLSEGGSPPYDDDNTSELKHTLVYGNSEPSDVLERYVDFVLGGWKDWPPPPQFPT